jgi:hypothetical protein
MSVNYVAKMTRDTLLLLAFGSRILIDPMLMSEITTTGEQSLSSSMESETIWRTSARVRSRGFGKAASGLA